MRVLQILNLLDVIETLPCCIQNKTNILMVTCQLRNTATIISVR